MSMRLRASQDSIHSVPVELQWERPVAQEQMESEFFSESLPASLFHVHRLVEKLYRDLPWPTHIKTITLITNVQGGKGDISAAAKVIRFLQKSSPHFFCDWIVNTRKFEEVEPFAAALDRSRLRVRQDKLDETVQTDLLILGPVKASYETEAYEEEYGLKLLGPRFGFLENAKESNSTLFNFTSRSALESAYRENRWDEVFNTAYKSLFPSHWEMCTGVTMGLQKGSGVFLDPDRLESPLSRIDCCPTYLLHLVDDTLRQDIFDALGVNEGDSLPNYDSVSLNSGYAHSLDSWTKFIDVVARHAAGRKRVAIVLNQKGEFTNLTTREFYDRVFTEERLSILRQCGYGKITVKGAEAEPLVIPGSADDQLPSFTVIIRPLFKPTDMKNLQLASERLLTTGDNTAAEAWAARCKLFVYEDVANGGAKREFLKQQAVIADSLSADLGTLLRLFGRNRPPLTTEEKERMAQILQKDTLSTDTLAFCNHITQCYSFEPVLEGAIKRAAWHYVYPELKEMEAESIDQEFKSALIEFLMKADTPSRVISVNNLSLIAEKIKNKILPNNF